MNTFILIIFMATSDVNAAGAASVSQEFNTETACKVAGQSLTDTAYKRRNYVLSWGCYSKGATK